jgi:RNA polymerase sigma-70 factor (ECF subfamily)
MAETDAERVERLRRGDQGAFEELLEAHGDAVRRHIARMVRDAGTADDLTQETFLRVWTRSGQWDGRGSFAGWLYRIATNLALNHLRSVKRRRQRPLELPAEPDDDDDDWAAPGWMIDASALGPDAIAELAERKELLRGLVDRLPEEKRQVIRLAHEAELPIREIAEQLGLPEGTVKSRLHYATKRLARQWHDLDTE